MQFRLPHGVPALSDYKHLLNTPDFAKMAAYSDAFQATYRDALHYYRLRWGVDPLRTWSRQWEYPYVFQQVQEAAQSLNRPLQILDAGSGVTFFPRLLQQEIGSVVLHCCDSDPRLETVYQKINARTERPVEFKMADLRKLPYADQSLDVIYCLSVLEHTREYPLIVQEFIRVLRPGGRLIVTFDISLDGHHDISVPMGQVLLNDLGQSVQSGEAHNLVSALQGSILTTREAAAINPKLLPWKYPLLNWLKRSLHKKRIVSWPPQLSVYCVTLSKPA